MADSATLYTLGFALIFMGVLVLVVAAILISITHSKNGKAKAAGAIIIGPVPIIFGSDKKYVKTMLMLSIVLTAVLIVVMLVYYFLLR
jgi:uncharacterized protein (TIGR00304 family)